MIRATLMLALAAPATACGAPLAPSAVTTSSFSLRSQPGESITLGQSFDYTIANSRFIPVMDASLRTLTFTLKQPDRLDTWDLTVSAPRGQQLRQGTYENAVSFDAAASTAPVLRFSGYGRGCTSTGRFVVLEAVYGTIGTVDRLHLTFEQRCNGATTVLLGELYVFDAGTR